MRSVGLLLAGLFVALFTVTTVAEIAAHGLDVISLVGLLIALMFAVGLIGAFRNPPQ